LFQQKMYRKHGQSNHHMLASLMASAETQSRTHPSPPKRTEVSLDNVYKMYLPTNEEW